MRPLAGCPGDDAAGRGKAPCRGKGGGTESESKAEDTCA